MSPKLRPALWGGLFIGVLSSLPFVSMLNGCCCLWVVCGGILTSYLLQESRPVPLTAGDGAVGGLLAGVVGAVISSIVSAIITLATGASMNAAIEQMLERGGELPPGFARTLEQMRDVPTAAWVALSFLAVLIVYPIFSMLGGLLGVAMFKKNPPPPPPGTVEVLPAEPPPM
jgi:hypothetical protein